MSLLRAFTAWQSEVLDSQLDFQLDSRLLNPRQPKVEVSLQRCHTSQEYSFLSKLESKLTASKLPYLLPLYM